jgi:Zn-finger nucleic acid-binding protein
MDRTKVTEVDVDTCGHCQSVWLDKGELAAMVHAPAADLGAVVGGLVAGPVPPVNPGLKLECPVCHGLLAAIAFEKRWLHRCDTCMGVLVEGEGLEPMINHLRWEMQKRPKG